MIWILHCKPWSDFATTYEKFVRNKKTTNEYKIKRKSKTLSNPRTIAVEMQRKNCRILIAIFGLYFFRPLPFFPTAVPGDMNSLCFHIFQVRKILHNFQLKSIQKFITEESNVSPASLIETQKFYYTDSLQARSQSPGVNTPHRTQAEKYRFSNFIKSQSY